MNFHKCTVQILERDHELIITENDHRDIPEIGSIWEQENKVVLNAIVEVNGSVITILFGTLVEKRVIWSNDYLYPYVSCVKAIHRTFVNWKATVRHN